MELYEIINNLEITFLVDKIEKIKKGPILNIRSTLICELLKIRAKEIMKSFGSREDYKTLPKKYLDLFHGKLFELEGEDIKIPSYYHKNAAKELLGVEKPYGFVESDLYELYDEKGISNNDIFKHISDRVYYGSEKRDAKIEEEHYKIDYKLEKNELFFYPILILDEDYKKIIADLLLCYYNLFENEDIDESDRTIREGNSIENEDTKSLQITLELRRVSHPGAFLEDEMLCYPIMEEIIHLETLLIHFLLQSYSYTSLVSLDLEDLKYQFISPLRLDEIQNVIMQIDKIILNSKNIMSNKKATIAKNERDKFKGFNFTLQEEKEELKEQMKKRNTKKKKVLKGYENKKNRSSWDDVLIYYIESNDSFCYLLGNRKRSLNFSPTQKALLIIILNMNKDKPNLGYVHEKITFSRLNTSLKELFNKTQKPIEYNGHQRVFNIIVKISKIKNYTDFKTSTITEEMETKLVAKKDRELEDKYSDNFEPEYDN